MAGILDSETHYSDFYEENDFTVDNIEEMSDFTHKDVPYINEYQSLKSKSTALTTSEQSRLTELVEILKGKLISVEMFNKISQSVAYMQKYFKEKTVDLLSAHEATMDSKVEDAQVSVDTKIEEANQTIDDKLTESIENINEQVSSASSTVESTVSEGVLHINEIISRLTIKYAYSDEQTYYPCNIITYNNGISTDVYICNKECKGISPDTLMSDGSTNPWTKLSLKGEQGEPGANFSYQGTWDSLKKYSETNLVWFNNTLYFSLQNDNLGHAPNEADSTYWKAWVYAMPDGSVTVEKLSENVLTLITNSTVLIDKTTGFKYHWELDNGKLYVVKN